MKRATFLFIALISFFVTMRAQEAVQYFNAGNPIEFMGQKYFFVWSSRPYEFYMLQEYLPAGQEFETYKDMFTVSVMFYGDAPFSAAKSLEMKVSELEERKKTDPMCSYVVSEVDGVKVLDFTVSDADDKNVKPNCLEIDVHYYKDVEFNGVKASLLLYYSHRSYGKNIKKSLKEFPKQCEDWNKQIVTLGITPQFKFKN